MAGSGPRAAWDGPSTPAEGVVRLTVLRPEFRRYLGAVGRRLRAPLRLRRALLAALRAQLEADVRAGAAPSAAILAMGLPVETAARLAAEHGLRPPLDPRRLFLPAACAVTAAALLAGGAAAWRAVRMASPPSIEYLGPVAPGGVRSGAASLVSADLEGDGAPLLVGVQAQGAAGALVAWALGSNGTASAVASLVLPPAALTQLAVGRFLPRAADEIALTTAPAGPGLPGALLVVGWQAGGLAVLARADLPWAAAAVAPGPAGPSGLQDLYVLGGPGGAPAAVQQWTTGGGALRLTASASVPGLPAAGQAGWSLQAGAAAGRDYLLISTAGSGRASPCATPPGGGAVLLDAATLRAVWQAGPGGPELVAVPGPPGGPLVAQAYGSFPPAGGSPFYRWDGAVWQAEGSAACGLRLAGPAPQAAPAGAAWLALDGYTVSWLGPNGAVRGGGGWPFGDPLLGFEAPRSLQATGPFLVRADPMTIEVVRWVGSALVRTWAGLDSTTVEPSLFEPLGTGWAFTDALGNVYAPAGSLWAWQGPGRLPGAPRPWVRVGGRTYGWGIAGGALVLTTTGGTVAYTAGGGPGTEQPLAVLALPLGGRSSDLAVLAGPAGGPAAALLILRAGRGGRLRQVAAAALAGAAARSAAVLPGRGAAAILLSAPGTAAPLGAYMWNGRQLRPAAWPAGAAALPSPLTALQAGGRWVAAGLQQPAQGPLRLLAVRLAGGRLVVRGRTVPLPAGGPAEALPVPDGSGRVLVAAAGRTLVYRLR